MVICCSVIMLDAFIFANLGQEDLIRNICIFSAKIKADALT